MSFSNNNTNRCRPNECICEPATAFKVDGTGCLNKRLLALCTYGWSVECIGWPCNVTLITPRLLHSVGCWHRQCWWPVEATALKQCGISIRLRRNGYYGYYVIRFQFRFIWYDAMYCAITRKNKIEPHAVSDSTHVESLTPWSFCPRGMKIPCSISHGILWNHHKKFACFPMEFHGYKTETIFCRLHRIWMVSKQ